jgi:Ni,Fe-hydrogenase III small subunit
MPMEIIPVDQLIPGLPEQPELILVLQYIALFRFIEFHSFKITFSATQAREIKAILMSVPGYVAKYFVLFMHLK